MKWFDPQNFNNVAIGDSMELHIPYINDRKNIISIIVERVSEYNFVWKLGLDEQIFKVTEVTYREE